MDRPIRYLRPFGSQARSGRVCRDDPLLIGGRVRAELNPSTGWQRRKHPQRCPRLRRFRHNSPLTCLGSILPARLDGWPRKSRLVWIISVLSRAVDPMPCLVALEVTYLREPLAVCNAGYGWIPSRLALELGAGTLLAPGISSRQCRHPCADRRRKSHHGAGRDDPAPIRDPHRPGITSDLFNTLVLRVITFAAPDTHLVALIWDHYMEPHLSLWEMVLHWLWLCSNNAGADDAAASLSRV